MTATALLAGLLVTAQAGAQQDNGPSCEDMTISERAMALCEAFFEALGCGGGLQREELRCHRLGQEFEHQTGIPHVLLPGLAGTQRRLGPDGGQLALGDLLVIELPPGALSSPLPLSARLAPRQHSEAWFQGLELARRGDRAVFDIWVGAGEQPPPLTGAAELEINLAPFMDSLNAVAGDDRFQVVTLAPAPDEPAATWRPQALGEPVARGEGEVRLRLALTPERFIRDEAVTGGRYEWLLSVVRLADKD